MEHSDGSPRRWAIALALFALAGQLVLVWSFDYFPSVDGPAHVHLAHAFHEALRGDSFYGGVVELNSRFNPNVATQVVLVALQAVASPFVAEKLWLSLYFAAFAAAAAYALAGINRNALCLLPLLVFCSFTFPLAFGFYNFAFSSVVFLAWFGYWWRHRESGAWRVIAGHAAFALLAYATHVFAFIVGLFGIGLAAAAATVPGVLASATLSGKRTTGLRALWTHTLPPLLGSLPELVACLQFLFGRFAAKTAAGAAGLAAPGPRRLSELAWATSFAPYDSTEALAAAAFVLVVALLLVYLLLRRPQLRASLPFAACLAGFLVLYLAMPSQWIVRWMPQRFQPLVFIALLLWMAALLPRTLDSRVWKLIGMVALVPLLLSVVARINVFQRIDGYYAELAQVAPDIAPNSTLIALRLHHSYRGEPYPARLDVLIQSGSRIATLRHSVDLKNFQGQSADHPIQFRPGVAATAALGGDRAITAFPPAVRLMEYERRTGRAIDYVITYGSRGEVDNVSALRRLDAQLAADYRLVRASKPRGLVRLYARNRADTDGEAR